MCSKNDKAAPRPGAELKSAQVWSITRRFTVLYVSSSAALLVMAIGLLYWALHRNLAARDHALLFSKVQVLRLLLREQPDKTDVLTSEVEHEASESPLRYYIRVLDESKQVLFETPGMKNRLPVALFAGTQLALAEDPDSRELLVDHHGAFLLVSVQADVGTNGRETRTLQVALDISADLTLMASFRWKLLIVLGLALVVATGVGGWLARQGVQPLVEITKSAQQVSASQLQDRIVVAHWPSELAQLASAFNAMLDRLEDSFARLSQFCGDLAHELRTPINNLRGEAEVSLSRARTLEEYQQTLASSLEEYERLSRMIDGLLFIARADNPMAVIERVRVNAAKEIEAVRDFYEALAGEQGVDVTCAGKADLLGDPGLFRRAAGNLLGNALRHTPSGGKIRLSLRTLDDQAVEFSVRDTGSGIAPEHLPRLFDRFYRAERSRSQATGGTGLGLAIVQSIMRLHGGSVGIQSALGQGTTVTLTFPAIPLSPPADKITEM